MTESEKIFTAGCTAGAAFALSPVIYGTVKNIIPKPIYENDAVSVCDGKFVTKSGKTVLLRGMNLNDEIFFCKRDGEAVSETVDEIYSGFVSRFGDYGAKTLISGYRDSFITDSDLKLIRKLGANCVRLPLRDYLIFPKNGCKGKPDFEKTDKTVARCKKLGLYVIFDYHSLSGELFDSGKNGFEARNAVVRFWSQVAAHYKNEPAVAAYDLLNRPLNGVAGTEEKVKLLHSFFNRIFKAIRNIDKEKIVILESAGFTESLPDAGKYNGKNVAFGLYSHFHTTFETDALVNSICEMKDCGIPFIVCKIRTDENWNYSLGKLCECGVSFLAGDYKGSGGNCRLFSGETDFADLSSESYDELMHKWKSSPLTENYTENKELAKTLKRYFSGGESKKFKPDINTRFGMHIIKGVKK